MRLCEICNTANGSAFENGECHICENIAIKTNEMVEKAKQLLIDEKITSFSISTIIPKDWLTREEKIWDIKIKQAESIKNLLNRKIVLDIRKTKELEYETDGEIRIVFDYKKNEVYLQKNDMFIFGRYRKLNSGLSQSRWKCPKCDGKGCPKCENKGKYYESVEERIGEPLKQATNAKEYVMHASGREDVDATNSAGRAFVIEIKEPQIRDIDLDLMGKKIAESKDVEVDDLRIVKRTFTETVTESHFDKEYEAEVEFGRDVEDKDITRIKELQAKTILQQTPNRVAHRRADLVRHRKIKSISMEKISKSKAKIKVMAEAGTYIKELISGDKGRTNPSIAELLGTSAVCTKLEVTKIDDGFLDFILDGMK